VSVDPAGSFDTSLSVYDSNGNALFSGSNGGAGNLDTSTTNGIVPGATYYIAVTGVAPGGTGSYSLQADFNPDVTPKVAQVHVHKDVSGKKISSIIIKFSESMDSTSAQTIAGNYALLHKTKAVKNAIQSATYDANSQSVTLALTKPLVIKKLMTFTVRVQGGGSLKSQTGQFFDGDGNGQAGGDYNLLLSNAPFA
jgi:hypothetical protein